MKISTENIKRKNPINRNNMFTSQDQVALQVRMGMEYLRTLNQTIILYEVDREATKVDDIYNEAKFKDLQFKTPVELNVMYKIDKHELKTYDTQSAKGYYIKLGQLEFTIYEKELEENDRDIKRGDYIGIQVTPEHMEFFIVTDDGRVNYDNAHTMWGTVPYYRSVKCSIVSDLSETQNL